MLNVVFFFSNKRKVVISKGDNLKKKETEIKSLLRRKNEGEDDPENIFSHQVMQRHGKGEQIQQD